MSQLVKWITFSSKLKNKVNAYKKRLDYDGQTDR